MRALRGAAPFLGSEAVAISPDGKNVYVASSNSDAIAVFERSARSGRLDQPRRRGLHRRERRRRVRDGTALERPNSVAVSPDGRNVYATSLGSDALDTSAGTRHGRFDSRRRRRRLHRGLREAGCTTGRALYGPDVVVASPDGRTCTSARSRATRSRSSPATRHRRARPAGRRGRLRRRGPDRRDPHGRVRHGVALGARGARDQPRWENVYAAAALSSALDVFEPEPSTGALTQLAAARAASCSPIAGCTTGASSPAPTRWTSARTAGRVCHVVPQQQHHHVHADAGHRTTRSARRHLRVRADMLAVGCSLGQRTGRTRGARGFA